MKMINKLKDLWWFIGIIGVLLGGVWSLSAKYNDFNRKNDELIETIKTTQQMALKSVIWNVGIPIAERSSACDIYLANGYNSLTKQECDLIIKKGAKNGTFSYLK